MTRKKRPSVEVAAERAAVLAGRLARAQARATAYAMVERLFTTTLLSTADIAQRTGYTRASIMRIARHYGWLRPEGASSRAAIGIKMDRLIRRYDR